MLGLVSTFCDFCKANSLKSFLYFGAPILLVPRSIAFKSSGDLPPPGIRPTPTSTSPMYVLQRQQCCRLYYFDTSPKHQLKWSRNHWSTRKSNSLSGVLESFTAKSNAFHWSPIVLITNLGWHQRISALMSDDNACICQQLDQGVVYYGNIGAVNWM